MAEHFDRVHLVDLDGEALRSALGRQPAGVAEKVALHGGFDAGGLLEVFRRWRGRAPSPADVDEAMAAARRGPTLPAAGLDLALSSSVLSQIILTAAERLGPRHPRLLDVVRALRTAHLRALAGALREGGLGVLVSDLVSSDTVPGLAGTPPELLSRRMRELVAQKNFFTGLNPFLVKASLETEAGLAELCGDVVLHEPWLWDIASGRSYLVFAVSFRRVGVGLSPASSLPP
jgi:hypothetical protein